MLRCMFPSSDTGSTNNKRDSGRDETDHDEKRAKLEKGYVIVPRRQWKWCNFGEKCPDRQDGTCLYRHADGIDRNGRKTGEQARGLNAPEDNKDDKVENSFGLGANAGQRSKSNAVPGQKGGKKVTFG